MKNVLAIARREIKSAFNSPVAYAVILGYLLFTGVYLYFIRGFYAVGQADLRSYFTIMPIVLAFLVPALTMRSWAEERRLGTYELLLTLPFTEGQLVLGKFLSSFSLDSLIESSKTRVSTFSKVENLSSNSFLINSELVYFFHDFNL